MKRYLFFFLVVLHALAAEEEEEFSLVNLTKSPISRVAGTVNIVTGNWVDQTAHQSTSGPDPYIVAHSYISSSLEEGTLADGWDLYHPSELVVYQSKEISYVYKDLPNPFPELVENELDTPSSVMVTKGQHQDKKTHSPDLGVPHRPPQDPKPWRYSSNYADNKSKLIYREAGGATYLFNGDNNARNFSPKIRGTGYNHISSIDSPTRRDIRRSNVWWDKNHDEWIVTLGDGTRRTYSRTDKHLHRPCPQQEPFYKASYHIKEEILPSGNRRWYHYDKDKELQSIQTVSSNEKYVIHFVQFHRRHDHVEVTTSEGLSTRFSLKKLKDRENANVVSSIDRPAMGSLSFSYCDKSSHHERRIDEKRHGNGRKDIAKFYHEGKNDVGIEVIHISDKKENTFLENRVRELWTQQLPGGPSVLSHTFTYKDWEHHCKANVKESDGATSTYVWDTERRPTWICRIGADGHRVNSEHFFWGEESNEGRLTRRTISDEKGSPLLDHRFEFDKEGNVVEETFRGIFTGRPDSELTFNHKKHVHGGEALTWKATYTNDGRCLKSADVDPLGNWTYYEYEKDRCLLTARFTCDQQKIIKREFFVYNSAAVCIKSIVDDGSSRKKEDLTNVTRRTTHRVTPRRVTPYFGSPDKERCTVWTPAGGEQFLTEERYTRDTLGRAIAKEIVDVSGVVQKRWTYTYDNFHRIIESCDPTGRVEYTSYDDDGRVAIKRTPEAKVSFTYDLLDRVIEEKKKFPDGSVESTCFQYDLTGRVVTKIDARGRETTKIRDLSGRITKTILPAIATENGTVRPETSTTYAGSHEFHISPTGATTELVRSAAGKVLVTSNPFGAKTYCTYDARGRLVQQEDSTGLVTLTSYDAFDRPTRVEQQSDGETLSVVTKTYQGFDLVEEQYPTKKIQYAYDTLGRKVHETVTDLLTGQSAVTRTEYDTLHRPIRVFHDGIGTEEQISYDAADREISRRVIGSDGSLLSVSSKTYDLAGRVIEDGVGRAGTIAKTTTTYGAYGLPSEIAYPDGTKKWFSYNPQCRWQDGHLYFHKVMTDGRGVVTEELLDSNDQVRMNIVRDPFSDVIYNRTMTFSVLGKPVLIEDHEILSGQEKSIVRTRLGYDVIGQLTSCTFGEGTSEEATWLYRYDAEGRKVEEIKPSGVALASTYDVKGRLSSFKSSDNTIAWNYHYNVQDLPELIENSVTGGSTVRRYNGLGSMVGETLENGLSMSYDIDVAGLLSRITYPDGSSASYQHSSGLLSAIERNGFLYQVNARDLSGVITSVTLPGSAGQITQSIDQMGRRTLIQHETFSEERTLFDPVGCCLERTINGDKEAFSYDYLCQLTSDNGRSASYDSLNHRVEIEGASATHNARHQILLQGERMFRYDVDGRRTQDDRYSYSYDACDRLTAVEDETTRYEYAYDSFNRRMSTTTIVNGQAGESGGGQEKFLWQGECEVGSVSGSSIISLRLLGDGLGGEIGAAVLFEKEGETFIPLHDLSGHVRVCLNTDGDVVERLDYTAFGLESRTGEVTPWTFSSKREDGGTGFLYFGRRYYEPSTATWLTQDPLGHSSGPNLYAYVKNNPLMCVDLYGLIDGQAGFASVEIGQDGRDSYSYVICDKGVWRSDQVGRENVPHLELTQNTWDQIFDKFSGRQCRVNMHTNGMCTTRQEVVQRQEKTYQIGQGRYDDTMAAYNPTNGFFPDLMETICNVLGIDTDVVVELRAQLEYVVDQCAEHNVGVVFDVTGHSQGTAIDKEILSVPEFGRQGIYHDSIGTITTFGAASFSPNGENFVQEGDFVPYLNPGNWSQFGSPNVHVIERKDDSIFDAHNFDGKGYQETLRDFIDHIMVTTK